MTMVSIKPFIPSNELPEDQDIEGKLLKVLTLDAALNASFPEPMRNAMERVLFLVNSYYSNKIEGNPTLPMDLVDPPHQAPTEDSNQNLQEINRNMEVQVKEAYSMVDESAITTKEFISNLHEEFFKGLPDSALLTEPNSEGVREQIVPGHFRVRDVKVGIHVPIDHTMINSFMEWFRLSYRPSYVHGLNKLLAAAASHHRLVWCHPFLDGNGRVCRMFTDLYMRQSGVVGYGLWSMSRGFARDTQNYYRMLQKADMPRQGDYDGTGELSDKGLLNFTNYFLETAVDQLEFFTSLFETKGLRSRIKQYFDARSKGVSLHPNAQGLPALRIEAKIVFMHLFDEGPSTQAELRDETGLSKHVLSECLAQMKAEELVIAPHKQPVCLSLNRECIPSLFPKLII